MSNTASNDHKGSRQILGVNPAIHRAWVSPSTDRDLDVGADTAFAPDRPGEARRISLGRRGFHSGSATGSPWLTAHVAVLKATVAETTAHGHLSSFILASSDVACSRSAC